MTCKNCDRENFSLEQNDNLIEEQLFLEPKENIVTKNIKEKRLQICTHCPFNLNGQCVKCGCFIAFRASLKNKNCPVNHW